MESRNSPVSVQMRPSFKENCMKKAGHTLSFRTCAFCPVSLQDQRDTLTPGKDLLWQAAREPVYKPGKGPLLSFTLYAGQDQGRKWARKRQLWELCWQTLVHKFPAQVPSGKRKEKKENHIHICSSKGKNYWEKNKEHWIHTWSCKGK